MNLGFLGQRDLLELLEFRVLKESLGQWVHLEKMGDQDKQDHWVQGAFQVSWDYQAQRVLMVTQERLVSWVLRVHQDKGVHLAKTVKLALQVQQVHMG